MIVFPMANSVSLGKSVAKHAHAKLGRLEARLFPDGEFYMRFHEDIGGKEIALIQSLHPNPNDSLLELHWAGRTAKQLGAKKVIGVAPYLAYMRQDKRFNKGEALSNHIMAHLLNMAVDRIVTVDPHLHRVHHLSDLFHIEQRKLTANEAIADYVSSKFSSKNTLMVGPDMESSQWASRIADKIGFESAIFLKERFSSHKVKINVTSELSWRGKNVVIVDDIVSSGHTMIEAVKEIRKRGAKAVHCICVHGIFAEDAYAKIKKAGAASIVSCNTIEHASNKIDLAPLIAESLK